MQEIGYLIILMICGIATAGYLIFKPDYAEKRALRVYNMCIIFIGVFLCAIWSWKAYAIMAPTDYAEYLALAIGAGVFMIYIGVLLVGFVARNFWIFRS